jgi:hypothetical protein
VLASYRSVQEFVAKASRQVEAAAGPALTARASTMIARLFTSGTSHDRAGAVLSGRGTKSARRFAAAMSSARPSAEYRPGAYNTRPARDFPAHGVTAAER